MSDRKIRIGGLMRCCIQSAAEYEGAEVPGLTAIGCRHHGDSNFPLMQLADDGIWEIVPRSAERQPEEVERDA